MCKWPLLYNCRTKSPWDPWHKWDFLVKSKQWDYHRMACASSYSVFTDLHLLLPVKLVCKLTSGVTLSEVTQKVNKAAGVYFFSHKRCHSVSSAGRVFSQGVNDVKRWRIFMTVFLHNIQRRILCFVFIFNGWILLWKVIVWHQLQQADFTIKLKKIWQTKSRSTLNTSTSLQVVDKF